ncbi:kirola-like [Salvia hispanica]|uniref:kirola-like n=1 Tax=Salvia hispanica TaxID=49212 RepID=UPI002009801B|nr:kirola-like [Salvia hispanica]
MGLHGKLVAAIEFKAGGGDVFHELLRHKPHQISTITPELIKGCDLHEGEFGHVGSIICWDYIIDGKVKKAKEVIQLIDEEKKLIQFKVIEGDLLELYKDFVFTSHIETKDGIDLVTSTFEYEMLNEDVEHPISTLSMLIDLIKAIETHHLAQP